MENNKTTEDFFDARNAVYKLSSEEQVKLINQFIWLLSSKEIINTTEALKLKDNG